MAGQDVPPDESEETTNGNSRAIPRPPPARPASSTPTGVGGAAIARPAPRAPANPVAPVRPGPAASLPPPRASSVGTPMPRDPNPIATPSAPAAPRPTPSSTATPISRKVPRPASAMQPAARPPQQGRAHTGIRGTGAELGVGQLFAERYRITKQVGKGGMGAVYLATQEPLSRMVAIKVLHGTADEVTVARFQREARLIAQLQHPHIVGLIDFGEDNGRLYLVMEFIDGESLTSLLEREAPFDPRRVVDVALQIAEALAVAHDMQVVHRDVKPDNIMVLATAGGQDFIKMLDFGVAKIKRDGPQNNTVETKAGLIVGSLRYISPEQVENGEITTRTDIYSYGCVLFEMLAGRRVFDYPSPADCAIAHITEPPKPPEVRGTTLQGPLVDFIMRCLDKKAAGRPANAREAIQALQLCRELPVRNYPGAAAPTMQNASGGLDRAQSASTQAGSPATTRGVRPLPPAAVAASVQAPAHESRRLDSQIRMPRPSGVQSFEIVGGEGSNTSTHLQGVRLAQRALEAAAMAPPKSRWWLWLLVGLAACGAGFAVVMLVRGGADASKAVVPVEASADVAAEVAESTDASAASAGADAMAADVAVAAAPDGGPDASAPDSVASGDGAVPVVDKTAGAMVTTEPTGATVLRDKKKLCTTPCLVTWTPEEQPPIVRISQKGYIDIDLQFVNADRGTDQHLELRKQP